MSSWPRCTTFKIAMAMAACWMALLQGVASQPSAGQQKEGADEVLAEMDGYQLRRSELELIIQVIPEAARKEVDTPEGRERFVRKYLEQKAMVLEALALNLAQDPIVQLEIQFSREQVLAESFKKRALQQIQVTDEEADEFYEQNKERFQQPVMVHLNRILVAKQREAQEVIAQANQGTSFAELASTFSKDIRNKDKGGRVGWVRPGEMEPAVEQVIFALEPGQIGPPVRTVQGWQVLQVTERHEAGYMPLETVREPLKAQLLEEKKKQALQSMGPEAFQKRGGKIYPSGEQP